MAAGKLVGAGYPGLKPRPTGARLKEVIRNGGIRNPTEFASRAVGKSAYFSGRSVPHL